jgi:hypothetical protein
MKLQNVETVRQTTGTGSNNLITPARIMGTEQKRVTRIVKVTLSSKVIAAGNLDMMGFFRWLTDNQRGYR